MPSIYDVKPAFQKLLQPVCHFLFNAKVTPNQLTIGTLLLSSAMGTWLFVGHEQNMPWIILPFFLICRMALNALDGMIAKEYNLKTPFGAIMNEVSDVLSDAALYLPFCRLSGAIVELPVIIVILAIVSELIGVLATTIGSSRRFDGPMGKSDRAFAFGLCGLLWGNGWIGHTGLNVFFVIILGLLLLTVANRFKNALRESA